MNEEDELFEELLKYSEEIDKNISEDYLVVIENITKFVNKIKTIDE